MKVRPSITLLTAELHALVASWRSRGARDYEIAQRLEAAVGEVLFRREALKLSGAEHARRQRRRVGLG